VHGRGRSGSVESRIRSRDLSPGYTFMLTGGGNLVKNGNNGWVCTLTFIQRRARQSGGVPPRPAGGTMSGGTATGTNCSVMTIDPSTFFSDHVVGRQWRGGSGFTA